MKDMLPPSPWEVEYWDTWAEALPVPKGTVFDARSYNSWKLTQPISPPNENGIREEKK